MSVTFMERRRLRVSLIPFYLQLYLLFLSWRIHLRMKKVPLLSALTRDPKLPAVMRKEDPFLTLDSDGRPILCYTKRPMLARWYRSIRQTVIRFFQ
jgi:hypothetical protein